MNKKCIDKENIKKDEHWLGNNAAFTCPLCGKVFIVSQIIHGGVEKCPNLVCGKSIAYYVGPIGAEDAKACVEW